ncbi:hypothetical protein AQUCO_00200339v1 [Aquilegia coerulea]|uniref:Uncharacterized protein n=1 Tax=Aquilegia coerulea TaxID=218851 RepID=A0A2G5F2T6_AQUCA|nr:hypothetical protein AQUCO_00200339v1 [Aquilegia coerulea]
MICTKCQIFGHNLKNCEFNLEKRVAALANSSRWIKPKKVALVAEKGNQITSHWKQVYNKNQAKEAQGCRMKEEKSMDTHQAAPRRTHTYSKRQLRVGNSLWYWDQIDLGNFLCMRLYRGSR